MSDQVRPARPADGPGLAALQLAVLRTRYAPLLPPGALAELDEAAAGRAWAQAAAAPAEGQVLVAQAADGALVGLAAVGPPGDADCDPALDGELATLLVHPDRVGGGHGSRLLAAATDTMRAAGATRAVSWVLEQDAPLQTFLSSAGWAPDGSRRTLDAGAPLIEIRLHAAL